MQTKSYKKQRSEAADEHLEFTSAVELMTAYKQRIITPHCAIHFGKAVKCGCYEAFFSHIDTLIKSYITNVRGHVTHALEVQMFEQKRTQFFFFSK